MLFAPFALAAFTLVPAPLPRAATAAAAPQVASASLECEVRHTDGSASLSVDLVLLSSPWRYPMRPGFVHRVDARADGAGTARADVRIGHSYTAWAVSEVVDGSYSLAGPVGGVSAGMEFALEESEKGQRVVAVEVLGLEAWDGAGPFAYDVTCLLGDRLVVDCELDGLGRAVIPPMPDAALFRVRSGAGVVIGDQLAVEVIRRPVQKDRTNIPDQRFRLAHRAASAASPAVTPRSETGKAVVLSSRNFR